MVKVAPEDQMRKNRLRWFGYYYHSLGGCGNQQGKDMVMIDGGIKDRSIPKLTLGAIVQMNLTSLHMKEHDALNRS